MKNRGPIAALAGIAVAVVCAVVWWQWRAPVDAPLGPVGAASPTVAEAPAASAAASAVPLIRYPVVASAAEAVSAAPDLTAALRALVDGASRSILQLDDFPRRLVATVDNLGRVRAPSRLWPVEPAGGRFAVESRDGAEFVSAANAVRYAPFLALAESVDLQRLHQVYVRHYAIFQQAYEELGFPGRHFNDRAVDVIDLLLATPEPPGPLMVHLPAINGPVQPERPWVLYEFDDPALQGLSAGQKVLLRMGLANQRRLKARLVELRGLLASGALAPGR